MCVFDTLELPQTEPSPTFFTQLQLTELMDQHLNGLRIKGAFNRVREMFSATKPRKFCFTKIRRHTVSDLSTMGYSYAAMEKR